MRVGEAQLVASSPKPFKRVWNNLVQMWPISAWRLVLRSASCCYEIDAQVIEPLQLAILIGSVSFRKPRRQGYVGPEETDLASNSCQWYS